MVLKGGEEVKTKILWSDLFYFKLFNTPKSLSYYIYDKTSMYLNNPSNMTCCEKLQMYLHYFSQNKFIHT
jgi:hypothetical protein